MRAIAELEPATGRRAPRRTRANVDMSTYTAASATVRALRDSVSASNRELNALRAGLEEIAEGDREAYAARITAKEKDMEGLRGRLDAASRDLQEIEQLFLSGNMTPGVALLQLPQASAADSTVVKLFLAEVDDKAVMMVSEGGAGMPDIVLPRGVFADYVEFPKTPSIRIQAVIDEEETLPPLAMTVIRLHNGSAPEIFENEDSTVYTSAPVNSRVKAESLMMALRAAGVSDISLLED